MNPTTSLQATTLEALYAEATQKRLWLDQVHAENKPTRHVTQTMLDAIHSYRLNHFEQEFRARAAQLVA